MSFLEYEQASIINNIQNQVKQRMIRKYNWKRIAYSKLEFLYKKLCRTIFSVKVSSNSQSLVNRMSSLGIDDLGRDVAFCLKQYIRLLLSRGVKLHTVIVLGSRVKKRAKPISDVDVMVIASDLPGRSTPELTNLPQKLLNVKRWLLLNDAPICLGIQPSACCSREEFLSWLKRFKISALDAIYYGKIIYDDGFWKHVLEVFRKIKKKYELNETNIRKLLSTL